MRRTVNDSKILRNAEVLSYWTQMEEEKWTGMGESRVWSLMLQCSSGCWFLRQEMVLPETGREEETQRFHGD